MRLHDSDSEECRRKLLSAEPPSFKSRYWPTIPTMSSCKGMLSRGTVQASHIFTETGRVRLLRWEETISMKWEIKLVIGGFLDLLLYIIQYNKKRSLFFKIIWPIISACNCKK